MEKPSKNQIFILAAALFLGGLQTSMAVRPAPDESPSFGQPGSPRLNFRPPSMLGGALVFTAVGLYDDEKAQATSGELNSQDYWWTKYDAMMLDLALKQHQPEGRIGLNLAVALRRLDDLTKKYPKHEEVKKWKTRFEEVQSKINPDADRRVYFGPECPWDESNYAQLWVNLHWAKVAASEKDWNTALSCLQNVQQNYKIMLAPDRMKNYPEELRKWVVESKPEADKLYAAVKAKSGG